MKISLCLMFIALPLSCQQMINPNLIAFICENLPSSPYCLTTTSTTTTTTTTTPPDPCPQIFSCVVPTLEALMNSMSESIMNQTMNLYDSRLLEAERKMDILEQNCSQTTVALQQFMEESRMETDQLKEALNKSLNRITDIEKKIAADCEIPNETRPPIKDGESIILGEMCVPYFCVDGQLLSNTSRLYNTTCPSSYKMFAGLGCVKLIKDDLTWCDARKRCFADGTDMVTVKDLTDFNLVTRFLRSESYSRITWTGLHRDVSSGVWMSTQGDVVASDSPIWENGSPSGSGGCAERRFSDGLTNTPCSHDHSSICQLPSS